MEKKKNPALAILIGSALSKAGMKKSADPEEAYEEDEGAEDEQLQAIADDMMEAIHSKDSVALKELLEEAFECLERLPHKEGPHLE